MKMVLFDLGKTLEDQDVLLPGARETLAAIRDMMDTTGDPAVLVLVSDFTIPQSADQIPRIQAEYYAILEALGIRGFFEPVAERVTLSTEVGAFKPDPRIFRAAADKVRPGLPFGDVLFVTENAAHVAAARRLGMEAVHFQGPGEMTGDIQQLNELVPLVKTWLAAPPLARSGSRRAASEDAAAGWTRFGDTLFLYGPREQARAAARGAAGRERVTTVPHDRLHLVVQKGRLFQKRHPDVPVLLDRGRYLVVDLDPEEAAHLHPGNDPCYSVRPLPENRAVFEVQERTAARAAPVDWIQALVDQVDRSSYELFLTRLAGFRTRLATGPEFLQAAAAVQDQLEGIGYRTETRTIRVGTGTSRNVIAERPGSGPEPRDVVLVTAHLDSINHEDGPMAPAPGADDNGSGSAGVLEIARVFQAHPAVHDLRLILFGGEEEGLHGSIQYVAEHPAAERRRIRAVVNMDMVGTLNETSAGVLLEGRPVSQGVIDGLAAAAATYTRLRVKTSLEAADSDHVPFLNVMIPAVLTIEGADQTNDNIHSARDTLDHIDYDLALEILRMNVAFTAVMIGRAA